MNNNINNKSISIFVKDDRVRIKNVKIVLQNKKKVCIMSLQRLEKKGKKRKERKKEASQLAS